VLAGVLVLFFGSVVRAYTPLDGHPPKVGDRVGTDGFAFPSDPRTAFGLPSGGRLRLRARPHPGLVGLRPPRDQGAVRARLPRPRREVPRLLRVVADEGFTTGSHPSPTDPLRHLQWVGSRGRGVTRGRGSMRA
jgi:hypothetical protein